MALREVGSGLGLDMGRAVGSRHGGLGLDMGI